MAVTHEARKHPRYAYRNTADNLVRNDGSLHFRWHRRRNCAKKYPGLNLESKKDFRKAKL